MSKPGPQEATARRPSTTLVAVICQDGVSSQDLGHPAQRRGSTVPPALSNLSGLSILPDQSQLSPTEATSSYFSGIPLAPATAPFDAAAPLQTLYPGEAPNLGGYQAVQPAYPAAMLVAAPALVPMPVPVATSPIAPTFPALSPTASLFPSNTAFVNPLGPTIAPVITNPVPAVQDPTRPAAAAIYSYNAPVPTAEAGLPLNSMLAARRQSMTSFPVPGAGAPIQLQGHNEPISVLPCAFGNLVDESGLPVRRASTSVINSNLHQGQPASFQPIAPRPSVRAKPAVPGTVAGAELSYPLTAAALPKEDTHHPSPRRPSVGEGPILGGLRRGSIPAKRVKSPTSPLYQPYPHPYPHFRNSEKSIPL
ncbi:hypothetical protein P389DRAFT_47322 [Cystobasidium minutum MCA 4210]|uniref:uncharacterized protein n=1 Tax=Cystobasidium minutum MCA 4210 TaxID=1397322 RepID=UPI0034CF6544|eukprot:jgi/Rhomi1/47322/CE47321_2992